MSDKPRLRALPGTFDIHRLPPTAEVPAEVRAATFVFTARTADELSVVCRPNASLAERAKVSPDWSCIQVEGPIDFNVVGLLAEIAGALAGAGISVFPISTFDTDYVFVRSRELERALGSLAGAGFPVVTRG